MAKDYYKILGVGRDATKKDIKKAYKRLAKKYHPDLNREDPHAEEKFKEINAAASVLADERKREMYDRYGTTAEGFGAGAGGFDFRDFDFSEFGFDFDRIFETLFGGGFGFRDFGFSRRRRSRRGSDLLQYLEVTLEEVAEGVKKKVSVRKLAECEKCQGSGAESESDIVQCDACSGRGMTRTTRRTPFGMFTTSMTCKKCRGTGKTVRKLCSACRGKGRVEKSKTLVVNVPAGIEENTKLRVANEGEAGMNQGPPGDLYLNIKIKPHPIFERVGDDIVCEVPISFVQACLGDEIEVPTLKSRAKLKIPQHTQTNTVFRMAGLGIRHLRRGGRGDQKVKVIIQVPKKFTKRQREILDEFAKESGESAKPQKSMFDKLKDYF